MSKKNIKAKKEAPKEKKNNVTVSKLNRQIKDLKEISNKLEDKHLRLKAEYDNYRRRKADEFSDLLKYDGQDIIKGFLPIIDDLYRIKEAKTNLKSNKDTSLESGIDMILKKINKFLESIDVKQFGDVNDKLDPELHEAMMTRNDNKKDDEMILEIFEKGYSYKEKIIRHAKVVVNKT